MKMVKEGGQRLNIYFGTDECRKTSIEQAASAWEGTLPKQKNKKEFISTSRTGFSVKSGCRASSLPVGARSNIFTRLSAASCCSSFGCRDIGKLLNEGNWNSRTSSAKGRTLK